MKLSIIICVYNTEEEYLREALCSIRASTLREVEICLVDDGSDRDYTALAAEFGARLQKTANGGILQARLAGIAMATGDFLAFLDSDDTVSIHYHQAMLEEAERRQADIVINDWAFHTAHTRYACPRDVTVSGSLSCSGDEVLDAFARQEGRMQAFFVPWNKVYRKALLLAAREAILASPLADARMCYGEDVLLNFYAFRAAKKVCNLHTGYYFYRIHATQSINVVSRARLEAQILSMSGVLTQMMASVGQHPLREKIMTHLRAWQLLMSRTHYSHAAAQKFTDLYPLIQRAYGVEKLEKSKWHDSSVYYRATLLPENFAAMDAAMRPLFDLQGEVALCYDRKDPYLGRLIEALAARGVSVRFSADAARTVPRGHVRPRDRIIHNTLVYAVGVLLFKKGSKLRALLKRVL